MNQPHLDAELLWVSPTGRVLAVAPAREGAVGRTTSELLGVDWRGLERAARGPRVVDTAAGRFGVDLVWRSPQVVEGASLRALPRGEDAIPFDLLLGEDPATRNAVDLAMRFARTDLPLLISTEPGCGAGTLARRIHDASPRRDAPLTMLRGAALAPSRALAALSVPNQGTLFVEGIDEAPLGAQQELLTALESGELSDTRLVASASPDARSGAERGGFAAGLYRMLRGTTIVLPPLREREDLAALARLALGDLGTVPPTLSDDALSALERHAWPDNLRELRDALRHADAVRGARGSIGRLDLPETVVASPARAAPTGQLRRASERQALDAALHAAQGNLSVAARKLGVARTTLYRMMKRHGLERG